MRNRLLLVLTMVKVAVEGRRAKSPFTHTHLPSASARMCNLCDLLTSAGCQSVLTPGSSFLPLRVFFLLAVCTFSLRYTCDCGAQSASEARVQDFVAFRHKLGETGEGYIRSILLSPSVHHHWERGKGGKTMEDITRIASFVRSGAFAEELAKDTLDLSREKSAHVTLHGLRWQLMSLCVSSSVEITADNIKDVLESTRKTTIDADSRTLEQLKTLHHNVNVKQRTQQRRTQRFAESSSSSSSASESSDGEHRSRGVHGENPLLPSQESTYAFQFRVDRLRREVRKDLDRLFWDLPLFDHPTTKLDLEHILISYCLSTNTEYKQGMHEVTGFLYYITQRDVSVLGNAATPSPRGSSDDVERALCTYVLSGRECKCAVPLALLTHIMSPQGLNLSSWYYAENDNDNGGVVAAAERVQQDLLKQVDATLQQQLDVEYGIHSVTYLVRWLRLLFLREFGFSQSTTIWSVILVEWLLCKRRGQAYVLNDSVVLYIATAMLQYIRQELLTDSTSALRRLMRYPPVEDVRPILTAAIALFSRNSLYGSFTPPAATATALPRSDESRVANTDLLTREGQRLNSVIERLERQWFPPPNQSEAEKQETTDAYIQAVAELKKIRDVLLHGVDE